MGIFSNVFEKRWFAVFMAMYVFIMIPFPFFFSKVYIRGYLGVPTYIYGWIFHAITVLVLIIIFAYQCLKRPEYQDFSFEKEEQEK